MSILSQETVQRILDGNDIVEVIQQYFPLKRAGVNFTALCPFHSEKTPSFNVNPSRQIFHCFGCHAGGDVIKFVMMYDNLPFPDAARRLAERAGVVVEEEAPDPQQIARRRNRDSLLKLQRGAAEWFHRMLFKSPLAQDARDYLRSRGIGMEVSRRWRFGYAPSDQRAFFDWARSEGYSMDQLVEGGLAKWREEDRPGAGAYAFFRHRLMFPVNNDLGEPVAFSGRVLSPDQKGGKYVNSPETPVFLKSRTFFGLDRSKRAVLREKRAVVCEGQIDLIAAYEAGIENVVAALGTAFTEDHARILRRHTDEVVLCFDSDEAGLSSATKTFRVLAPTGMLVRLALLPPGEDPDSLIRKSGAGALREALDSAPEFFDFQIDRRAGPLSQGSLRDRLNFARDLAADIALVEDKMLQDSLVSRVTVRLGVGEEDIRKLVRSAVQSSARIESSRRRREAAASVRNRERGDGEGSPGAAPAGNEEFAIENRSVRLLCRALLAEPETRAAVTAAEPPGFLRDLAETELLTRIWRSPVDPGSPSSVNAFLATLPGGEAAFLRRLLAEESARITPELAGDCLAALRRQGVQRRIAAVKALMGRDGLPGAELESLGKQLLDLRNQLHET